MAPTDANDGSTGSEGSDLEEKRPVMQLFGYEVSAPANMKRPILRLSILVGLNIILLLGLRIALR